jgi:hypothetical protein
MKRMIVVVALLALMSPVTASALDSCDKAAKFGWHSLYWNTVCAFDILIDW